MVIAHIAYFRFIAQKESIQILGLKKNYSLLSFL